MAERSDDRGEGERGDAAAEERRSPSPRHADGENDRQRFDHLDRAREECGQKQEDVTHCVQPTAA
jgi:hypothetical protein